MSAAEVVDTIRRNVDICHLLTVDYQRRLRSHGENWTTKCVKTHRPSGMVVNQKQQLFFCPTCGASGDVIGLVMSLDGCTFIDAMKKLMMRALRHR